MTRRCTAPEVLARMELALITDTPPDPEVAFVLDLATCVPPMEGTDDDDPAR